MKNSENQKSTREYKVYIHRLKTWVEVTEEQYYAYYRDIWATRKRTQAHGQCMCPKSKTWMCDGDCLACEFRAAGDNLSLDYTIEDGEGNQKSWADDLQDDTPDAQSIMEDRELLCALYQKLQELDPEGRRMQPWRDLRRFGYPHLSQVGHGGRVGFLAPGCWWTAGGFSKCAPCRR